MRWRLLLGLILLWPATLAAQTTCSANCTVPQGTPFSVVADHAGLITDSYQLKENGVQVASQPVSALQAGSISFGFPSGKTTLGQYIYVIAATNIVGSTDSTAITVTITPSTAPVPVSNIRIIR